MSENVPDYSCELPTIINKLFAVEELCTSVDTEQYHSSRNIMEGISAILKDIGDELEAINRGLYGKVTLNFPSK